MTVECMRDWLREVYPFPKWQDKVDRMHEPQVIAVYYNMRKLNKLSPKKKNQQTEQSHQISIWEWMIQNERNGKDSECKTVF